MKPFWTTLCALLLSWSPLCGQEMQEVLEEHAVPFQDIADFEQLFREIVGSRLVLMGESTHGTSEFYRWRADLSRYLIEEKGFRFIAVEGDWPAMSRINEFVKHKPGAPESLRQAMDAIDRWPLWMWRNREVKELISWMHEYNRNLEPRKRAGFYGVDLYAKQQAMQDVVDWFASVDREQSHRVERIYRCLSRFSGARDYLMRVGRTGDDCSMEVKQVLEKVQDLAPDPGIAGSWDYFNAEQNARLVVNAERHFRANLERSPASWNYRAQHFELTANRLMGYYGGESRGIVWAHNTHVGDARATDMYRQGMVNIGQLSRERWGEDLVYIIGFGTYEGEVFAAGQWEGNRENMRIPPAIAGSWERMLGEAEPEQLYLLFSGNELRKAIGRPLPHRAIGVTYDPLREAQGNYVNSLMAQRYDAFVFIRRTGVLDALD